ncbi:MAG: hypothetical protein ACT4OP_08770 [Actinomycetota bacterium]
MSGLRRVLTWTVAGVIGLILLFFLFEWAGNLLDSGGAIGG